MKSTAINTVYVVMHAHVKDHEMLEFWRSVGKGYIMWVFSDERDAIKAMHQANENVNPKYEKFYIVEKTLW